MRVRVLAIGLVGLLGCSSSDSGGGPAPAPAPTSTVEPSSLVKPPASCAFTCPAAACAEAKAPYACPSLAAWSSLPHADACPAWDGTYPTPVSTKCTASAPSGDAVKRAGPDPNDALTTVLPDGRRIHAAGAEWLFDEADLTAGMPQSVITVPGTSWLLVVDVGYGPHAVRVVDASKIGAGNPVVSYVKFDVPEILNAGIAYVAPDLVLVATDDGVVQALKLDTATGTLTRDDARNIALPASTDDTGKPGNYYVGGLALSPDGKRLLVSSVFDRRVLVFGTSPADYGTRLGTVQLGGSASFAAAFDPNDPAGAHAYVTTAQNRKVAEIDLTNPAAPVVSRSFSTDKNPQAIAFLDARWMAVANDFGDTITLVDRTAGTSTAVPVDVAGSLHGAEPSTLAYDPAAKRLYATLAGINAVTAWDVDLTVTPPALRVAGRLPTSWWPSGIAVLPGGELAIGSMRGHGNGPLTTPYPVSHGFSMHGVRGGIQKVPAPSASDLQAGEAAVKQANDVGGRAGAPQVTCPAGEDDFPVPATNTKGPSKQIDTIVFVVRENKTFDGVLGDLPTVDGDPSLTLKATRADMDKVWANFRSLVRTFATSDNYYTSAELSIQGHTWATFGRTSDFTEKTWSLTNYSRSAYRSQVQPQGVSDIGTPDEGSMFDWLLTNGVTLDILGEAEGSPRVKSETHPPTDFAYPGGFVQSLGYPDVEKSCYVAARARVVCDLGRFVFMTLPNDHTLGAAPTTASPETMVAVNDEATGAVIDAISHSPKWAHALVVVTEDDPADGGDHVDHHRTPVLFASPWVKRGYVSKTHMDVSSLHKLFAHILGIPYPNAIVADAALPLDLFASTPDYTPYTVTPRVWPLSCGQDATRAEQAITASFDFRDVDEQPGLDAQIWRWMRGHQIPEVTPEVERAIAHTREWNARHEGDDDDR